MCPSSHISGQTPPTRNTSYQNLPTEYSNCSNSSIQPLQYRVKKVQTLNLKSHLSPFWKASSWKVLIHPPPEKLGKPSLLLSFRLFLAQAEAVTLLVFLCPRPQGCLLVHALNPQSQNIITCMWTDLDSHRLTNTPGLTYPRGSGTSHFYLAKLRP